MTQEQRIEQLEKIVTELSDRVLSLEINEFPRKSIERLLPTEKLRTRFLDNLLVDPNLVPQRVKEVVNR